MVSYLGLNSAPVRDDVEVVIYCRTLTVSQFVFIDLRLLPLWQLCPIYKLFEEEHTAVELGIS